MLQKSVGQHISSPNSTNVDEIWYRVMYAKSSYSDLPLYNTVEPDLGFSYIITGSQIKSPPVRLPPRKFPR
jgi:hypothetical protein